MAGDLTFPYNELRDSFQREGGYQVQEQKDGLTVYFEPYFTDGHFDSDDMHRLCMFFRRKGEDATFEDFFVEYPDGPHDVDITAAREPLRIWLEYMMRDDLRGPGRGNPKG